MSTPRKWIVPLAAALIVGIMTGCIQFPTGPVVSQIAQSPATVTTPGRSVQSGSLIGGVDSLLSDAGKLVFNTLDIVGAVGGSLTNDRWTLNVPPNAISGNATIQLGVLNAASPACSIEITPASANHFAVPVQLTVDCSSIPTDRLQRYSIFWYDPAAANWVPVVSSVDLQSKTISAPLQHFSEYSVRPLTGRAGW